MEALSRAMIQYGIPDDRTTVIAQELDIESIENLRDMEMFDLIFVDVQFRACLINLRNAYKGEGKTDWPVPNEADWRGISLAFFKGFLPLWPLETP